MCLLSSFASVLTSDGLNRKDRSSQLMGWKVRPKSDDALSPDGLYYIIGTSVPIHNNGDAGRPAMPTRKGAKEPKIRGTEAPKEQGSNSSSTSWEHSFSGPDWQESGQSLRLDNQYEWRRRPGLARSTYLVPKRFSEKKWQGNQERKREGLGKKKHRNSCNIFASVQTRHSHTHGAF